VDGQSFTVGPGDNDYAAAKTGVDGSLVIVSDATDMFASPLRVWASFMNSYERIVVNPDQEFHTRVTTAHATATDDNPDKVNLVTAHNYNATPLFTADEKKQQQPQNCANAIGQMNKGLRLGGGASKSTYANVLRLARGERPAVAGMALQAAAPETYLAYADLRGASHYPTNIPAQRPVTIVSPVGLVYARPQDDNDSVPAFTAVHHSDALQQIDQLTGQAWSQSTELISGKPRVGSIWSDFWHWLRHIVDDVVNYITHIIVAVAEEVVVGIRMIIKGVETVFKAIITVVEDIAAAVGSFFQMLKKAIEDLITALSVLFHFGEIIHTHRWIRDQINANLQQAIGAMQNQVKPHLDQFFLQGELAVEALFTKIRQQLSINDDTQINDVNSARSTAHTVFTAGPGKVGANSGGSSHAVQCTHTTQKMKNGLSSATQPAQSGLRLSKDARAISDDDPLNAFVTNFVDSLENDPIISSAYNELKGAIGKIGHSQSAGDFFKSALNLLLTIIEDLILGMVAVTKALVDGLIGAIEALINTVQQLLNTPINIPFISWLYHSLFGEQLTILNAVSLVAAIPVTIIYRVVEGHYPSQDGITGAGVTSPALTERRTAPDPDVFKKMQGLVGGTLAGCQGVARAVVDLFGSNLKEDLRFMQILVLALGVGYVSIYLPLVTSAAPTGSQWAAWGLGMSLALVGTLGLINLTDKDEEKFFKNALSFLRAGLGAARFIVFVVDFAKTPKRNAVTDVQFARNLFLGLPPGFNWLKILKQPEANLALAVIDVVTGVVVCALDITAAFVDPESEPSMG
jgi:hypothetical protein